MRGTSTSSTRSVPGGAHSCPDAGWRWPVTPSPSFCPFNLLPVVPPLILANFMQHCLTLDLGFWDRLAWDVYYLLCQTRRCWGLSLEWHCFLQTERGLPQSCASFIRWVVPQSMDILSPALTLSVGPPQRGVVPSSNIGLLRRCLAPGCRHENWLLLLLPRAYPGRSTVL